ncbi:MAG TPA: hypothetical protein VK369_02870 [Segetibacter sp.]|nr:hypothetical protein [Segetibacter sp.]
MIFSKQYYVTGNLIYLEGIVGPNLYFYGASDDAKCCTTSLKVIYGSKCKTKSFLFQRLTHKEMPFGISN